MFRCNLDSLGENVKGVLGDLCNNVGNSLYIHCVAYCSRRKVKLEYQP